MSNLPTATSSPSSTSSSAGHLKMTSSIGDDVKDRHPSLNVIDTDVKARQEWLEQQAREAADKNMSNKTKKITALAPKDGFAPHQPTHLKGVAAMKYRLEQQQREERLKHDHTAHQTSHWGQSAGGAPHGQYKKKTVDNRGVAPPKKLSDLP
jgi:hypothetical protein